MECRNELCKRQWAKCLKKMFCNFLDTFRYAYYSLSLVIKTVNLYHVIHDISGDFFLG